MASAPEPSVVIQSVLDRVGIRRVVSVDDDYSRGRQAIDVETLYASIAALPPNEAEALFKPEDDVYSPNEAVFNARFRKFWQDADEEARRELHAQVRRTQPDGNVEATEVDLASVEATPALFGTIPVEKFNLQEWRSASNEVYETSATIKTMILFDQDFRLDGGSTKEGTQLVKTTLAQPNSQHILCCMLSHHFHEATLQEDWKRLCAEEDFKPSQVVAIPKELVIKDPGAFASLVKLSAVAPFYDEMRDEILRITEEGVRKAHTAVSELGLVDLDRMVFRASDSEGVWEPDTLVRIFGIVFRHSTRDAALQSEKLWNSSSSIRSLSGVATPSLEEAKGAVWQFNRSENYEEADDLNRLHRPIDLGDIFGRKNGKRYVLIAPQCDLMVRTEKGFRGRNADSVKEVTLAEVVERDPGNALGWRIDFFRENVPMVVDFKKTVTVKLTCLDMCVFNSDGKATLSLSDQPPSLLIPAWQKRHGIIKKELQRILEVYERIAPAAKQKQDVVKLLIRPDGQGQFNGTLSSEERSVSLDLQRVGRLLPPRSTALVKAYGEFLNRDAFEHSFGARH